MKLASTFILAICTVSAQPSNHALLRIEAEPMPQDEAIDIIKEYIEDAVQTVNDTVNNLLEKAKEQAASAKETMLEINKNGDDKVASFIDDTDAKIAAMAKQGLDYKMCVQENKQGLKYFYADVNELVAKCINYAYVNAKKLHGNVLEKVSNATLYISDLRDIFDMCYHPSNPIGSVTCTIAKAGDVRRHLTDMVRSATDAFNNLSSLVSESVTCIKDSMTDNRARAASIMEQIKNCAAA